MQSPDSPGHHDQQIQRLREWRNRPVPDLSMGFLEKHFKQNIEKPHKQFGPLIALWMEMVPEELAARTALRSFQRGLLRVTVADSATLYQLDRAMRSGLQRAIQSASKAPLRRIKLEIGTIAGLE
jgi:hypothetical protein